MTTLFKRDSENITLPSWVFRILVLCVTFTTGWGVSGSVQSINQELNNAQRKEIGEIIEKGGVGLNVIRNTKDIEELRTLLKEIRNELAAIDANLNRIRGRLER